MRCPRCQSVVLRVRVHGVEVDHCTACGGVWLDAGELEILLRKEIALAEIMAGVSGVSAVSAAVDLPPP